MKKSLSLLLAIALVISMFAATSAFAATNQEEFDALKAAGIVTGYPDGSAGLTQDMTRAEFAKVLANLNGLSEDPASAAVYTDLPTSADYWARGYIGAATKAGLVNGIAVNKFSPNGKVTVEQVAKTLVISLGLQESSSEVSGQVSAWAKGYVASAINAGLLDKNLNYKANATRGLLFHASYVAFNQMGAGVKVTGYNVVDSKTVEVTFSDNGKETKTLDTALEVGKETTISVTHNGVSYPVVVKWAAPAVDAMIAGAKTIKVTFDQAVDTSKVAVSVKKGANTVSVASTTWSDDKKTATVALSSKVTAGTYTVSVSGLAAPFSKDLTATDEVVKSIEILSDYAAVTNNSTRTDAVVGYKVTNQYGEDITSTTQLTGSSSVGGTVDAIGGTATIHAPFAMTLDSPVVLTLINATTAVSATKTLKVSASSLPAEITVVRQYNASGNTLTADSGDDYYLLLSVKDQYGNPITNTTTLSDSLIVSVSNPTVATINGYSPATSKASFVTQTVDGTSYPALKLATNNGTYTAGTSVVTLIAPSGGKSTSFTITVAEGVKSDTIVLGDVGTIASGETVKIPVTVTDLNGKEITNPADLNTANKNTYVTVTPDLGDFVRENTQMYYQFQAGANNTSASIYTTLTFMTKSFKVVTKTFEIKPATVPTAINSLDSDVNTTILAGQTVSISAANLAVEDQYGRLFGDADLAGKLGNTSYTIAVTGDDSNGAITLASGNNDNDTILSSGADSVVVTGAAKGTESITFTLRNNGTPVSGGTFTVTFRTVETSEITSYGVDDIGKIYTNASYAVTPSVYGLTSDGKKVALPNDGNFYTLQTSNASNVANGGVTALNGVLNASTAEFKDGYSEGTATATVTINATGAQITKTYTVTSTPPSVATLEVRQNGSAVSTLTLSTAAVAGNDGFALEDLASYLYAKDVYGKEYTSGAGIGTNGQISFAGGSGNATPSLLIQGLTNAGGNTTPTISGNGTTGAKILGLESGDSFTVTLSTGAGSAKVLVYIV